MSKLDDKIELYTTKMQEIETDFDAALLEKITRALGPSIYNKDAESIACSDASERDRVRDSFLIKKLGLDAEKETLDAAVLEVCQKMGTSNRNKYRALFYYFLVKKFNKENIYA